MWFQGFKQFLTSIASRVTIWYTGFMIIILLAIGKNENYIENHYDME